MGYYDLSKEERQTLVHKMKGDLIDDLNNCNITSILRYSLNDDFYVRKNVSLILRRIYNKKKPLEQK